MVRSNWNDFVRIITDLQLPSMDHVLTLIVQWFEKRSKAFEPTYLYVVEKGYFLLSEGANAQHGVRSISVTISGRNPCFGNGSLSTPYLRTFFFLWILPVGCKK